MHSVVDAAHFKMNQLIRRIMSAYEKNADMIGIGMYHVGSDKYTDIAIKFNEAINHFLCQSFDEKCNYNDSISSLNSLASSIESLL